MTLGDKHIQIASTDERIQSTWGVISPYVHLNMLIYIVYSMCIGVCDRVPTSCVMLFIFEFCNIYIFTNMSNTSLGAATRTLCQFRQCPLCTNTFTMLPMVYMCEIVTLCVYCVSNHTHAQTHTCAHTSSRARVQFRDSWCTRHKQIGRASFQCNRIGGPYIGGVVAYTYSWYTHQTSDAAAQNYACHMIHVASDANRDPWEAQQNAIFSLRGSPIPFSYIDYSALGLCGGMMDDECGMCVRRMAHITWLALSGRCTHTTREYICMWSTATSHISMWWNQIYRLYERFKAVFLAQVYLKVVAQIANWYKLIIALKNLNWFIIVYASSW